MSINREKINKLFEAFGAMIIKFRFLIVIVCLAITGGMFSQLQNLKMDMSRESFLYKDDPMRVMHDKFVEQYGNDRFVVIGIESESIFSDAFLSRLKALHEELEKEVPWVDEVTSLINARDTHGTANALVVGELLEDWPKQQSEFLEIRDRAINNPIYKNILLDEQGKITTIIIQPVAYTDMDIQQDMDLAISESSFDDLSADAQKQKLGSEHYAEFVSSIRTVIEKHEIEGFDLRLAGSPVVNSDMVSILKKDNSKFMTLCYAFILILLFVMFRRVVPVILGFIVIIMTIISAIGVMAASGVSFKLPTQIIPAFLSAVSVGASMHILSIYYRQIRLGMLKKDSLIYSISHSGLAIILTSITTAIGLASLALSEMAPIAELGIYAAIGVIFSMIYSLFFVPAVLSILPIKMPAKVVKTSFLDKILTALGSFSHKNARKISFIAVMMAVLFIVIAGNIKFSHFPLKWLPSDLPVRQDTEFLDEALRGTVSLEIVVDTGSENGLYNIDLLNRLDQLSDTLENDYSPNKNAIGDDLFVGKTTSITHILKEIHRALHENSPQFYKIPENPDIIPHEFFLFENSGTDDLEDFVDPSFSKARFSIKMPYRDAVSYSNFIKELELKVQNKIGDLAKVSITGSVAMSNRIISNAMNNMAFSFVIAFAVISILMIILAGNIKLGIASMLPNILPIIITLGVWVAIGKPLNILTLLIGSIILGVAVDDTIHFMHSFCRYISEGNKVAKAIELTLTGAGRAMLFSTIVLTGGFAVYSFASMSQMVEFGILAATSIILAFFADVIVAPALVTLITKED